MEISKLVTWADSCAVSSMRSRCKGLASGGSLFESGMSSFANILCGFFYSGISL